MPLATREVLLLEQTTSEDGVNNKRNGRHTEILGQIQFLVIHSPLGWP